MGLFAHWVCVKGPADALRDAGFVEVVEAQTPGWLTGYPEEGALPPEWEEFDELVARVAASAGGPPFGSWIHDSDVGYLVAADDHGRITRLVVNPEAGEAYDVPLPEGWPDGAIARFAEWSKGAPNALDATTVEEVVGRDWTFAEEGVQELHERLGLAVPYEVQPNATAPTPLPRATVDVIEARSFGGYEAPLPWMTEAFVVGALLVLWRQARHVPGVGADFIGIWDRESPEEPIARFPLLSRGESQAMEELRRLQEPLLWAEVGGDELAGFERPLDPLPTLRLIRRELPWKEARYVAGYGSDCIGLWDRERPGEPIERFPPDHAGLRAAYEDVTRLLFEDVLSRKELGGLRLFLPRVEPRLVQQEISPDFLDHVQGLSPARRAAWEEELKRGSWVRTPSGPWLLAEEDEDDAWRPTLRGAGRYFLYAYGLTGAETQDETYLICMGNFPTEQDAREAATRHHAQGEWRPVPDEVPRNLLDTVRWLLADG
jgi:hypothetical protein